MRTHCERCRWGNVHDSAIRMRETEGTCPHRPGGPMSLNPPALRRRPPDMQYRWVGRGGDARLNGTPRLAEPGVLPGGLEHMAALPGVIVVVETQEVPPQIPCVGMAPRGVKFL